MFAHFRQLCEGEQIIFHQFAASGQGIGGGHVPTVFFQQTHSRAIHRELPRRKHADVRPIADVRAHFRACFKHDGRFATFQQMCDGGQPHRASADDGDR